MAQKVVKFHPALVKVVWVCMLAVVSPANQIGSLIFPTPVNPELTVLSQAVVNPLVSVLVKEAMSFNRVLVFPVPPSLPESPEVFVGSNPAGSCVDIRGLNEVSVSIC